MLTPEKNYDFRKRMLEIHKPNLRNAALSPKINDFVLENGFTVYIPKDADVVVNTAARDFAEYLFTSMGISAMLQVDTGRRITNSVRLALTEQEPVDLCKANGPRGYRMEISDAGITIHGFDTRGIAQGLYYLEFLMNLRKAPYLEKTTYFRKPAFTPQMVHSGYGIDNYPNEHLAAIAHEGRDAILVFVKGVDKTPNFYLDFNELVYRAAKYGIDVYAYSYIHSEMHPEDPAAERYYENAFGSLFRECPGLKGLVLVGESIRFPSKDERISASAVDGIPTGKPSSLTFPCRDYPQLLDVIKKSVFKYQPKADIVFWTYNWSQVDPKLSVELIHQLPTDISVLSTFEKSARMPNKDGVPHYATDYTIIINGPTEMFKQEAAAAKERGIRFYAMTNTGGSTWDFGYIPYQPAPYSWMKRFRSALEYHKNANLCGLMESHHYGFTPSIISKLSQIVFSDPECDMEKALEMVIECEYGACHVHEIKEALRLWSDSTEYMTHSRTDSYGACRVGPARPFCLREEKKQPAKEYAHFGNGILHGMYKADFCLEVGFGAERIPKELASWEKSKVCMDKGIEILESIPDPNDELLRLINMGKFISCGLFTGANIKRFYLAKCRLDVATSETAGAVLDELYDILEAEKKNVENAIPLAELDSRLGWEPSMEYLADAKALRWKLRLLDYTQNHELGMYRRLL